MKLGGCLYNVKKYLYSSVSRTYSLQQAGTLASVEGASANCCETYEGVEAGDFSNRGVFTHISCLPSWTSLVWKLYQLWFQCCEDRWGCRNHRITEWSGLEGTSVG